MKAHKDPPISPEKPPHGPKELVLIAAASASAKTPTGTGGEIAQP